MINRRVITQLPGAETQLPGSPTLQWLPACQIHELYVAICEARRGGSVMRTAAWDVVLPLLWPGPCCICLLGSFDQEQTWDCSRVHWSCSLQGTTSYWFCSCSFDHVFVQCETDDFETSTLSNRQHMIKPVSNRCIKSTLLVCDYSRI